MNPYTARTERTHTNAEVLGDFETLMEASHDITLVGRVMAIRGQGGIAFVPLFDGSETLQAVFKEDSIDPEKFTLFRETIDVADFMQVTGKLFVTEKGHQSLLVDDWKILTKSLAPLPDKHKGLQEPTGK